MTFSLSITRDYSVLLRVLIRDNLARFRCRMKRGLGFQTDIVNAQFSTPGAYLKF